MLNSDDSRLCAVGYGQFVREVHILDFSRDLYSEVLTLKFVQRLRDEMKFDGEDQLLKQIYADIGKTREILI
ncbi:MAG: riboflavin kinase [Anaerolineae bacterium]|nr:riboflavin kinase [Anaerolineae bacterium]